MKHRFELAHFEQSRSYRSCSVCEALLTSDDKTYTCKDIPESELKRLCDINEDFSGTQGHHICRPCYIYCIKKSSANKMSLRSMESSHQSRVLASDTDEDLLLKILNVYLYICRLCLEDGYFLFITVYEYFSDLVSKRCYVLQYDRVNKSPIFVKGKIIHQFGELLIVRRDAGKRGTFFLQCRDVS